MSVQNRQFHSNGGQLPQNFRWNRSPHTNHSSPHKTMVNGLWCGARMRSQLFFVLSQITCLTERQTKTHGQTEFSSLDRICIPCIVVKINWLTALTNLINFFQICSSPNSAISPTHNKMVQRTFLPPTSFTFSAAFTSCKTQNAVIETVTDSDNSSTQRNV